MALYSNKDSQLGAPKHLKLGQVGGIKIATDGTAMSGYVNGAALTISAPPAGGVQAAGTILVTAGAITGITLTNPGAGYTTAPTVTAPTGLHAVLTAGINAIARSSTLVNTGIVFVDSDVEAKKTANRKKGIKTAGWYKITEKIQSDGTMRYLTEHLMAVSSGGSKVATTGDTKGDDFVVADAEIAITTQPVNVSVTAPAAASFSVIATGTSLTYQWQRKIGSVWTDQVANATYTTTTAATMGVSNSTGLTGTNFRCVVTGSSGAAQVKSSTAKLTVA
jgi:hypothetical protein